MDVFILYRDRHQHRFPLGSVPILSLSVSASVNAQLFLLPFQGIVWTPSKMIARLGKEIDNPDSVYYWCYKVSLLNQFIDYLSPNLL